MTKGNPWKSLLLFTVPLLIGNLFQQMYSTADAIILGRFVGDDALAAVGASMSFFFLIMVVMMGISMGVGVMVAQYFGAKKREELSRTVGAALTITTVIGVMMMVAAPFVTRPLLTLMETPAEILDDSVMYMNILMLGVLGLAYFNILSGILRGMGDAFSPLLYLAFASVLNIILNLILIPTFGVWGAAIGTVFAQGLTSLLCLRRLMKMRDTFDMSIKYLKPQKKYVQQVLRLGIPTAASQAIFAVAMMVIQPLANNLHNYFPGFLAANIIVMRMDGFVMMPNFSFGNAISVYAGQNIGAGKIERVSQGVKQCAMMALGTAVVLVSIVLLFSRPIAGVFTDTPEVIEMAMRFLRILAIGYIVFSLNMVLWGAIRGAGDAITPLWGSVVNTLVVRVPTAFLFVHLLGTPEALMYSLLTAWVTNAMLGAAAYRFGKWRTKGIVQRDKQDDTAPGEASQGVQCNDARDRVGHLLEQCDFGNGNIVLTPLEADGMSSARMFVCNGYYVIKYVNGSNCDTVEMRLHKHEYDFYKTYAGMWDFLPEIVLQVADGNEQLIVMKRYETISGARWDTALQQQAMDICARINALDIEAPYKHSWLETEQEPGQCSLAGSLENWCKLQEKFPKHMDAVVLQEIHDNFYAIAEYAQGLAIPDTFNHGDFAPTQCLLDSDGERLILVDWQSTHIGRGIGAVAYFCSRGLEAGAQFDKSRMIQMYQEALLRHTGIDIGINMLEDYAAVTDLLVAFRYSAEYLQEAGEDRVVGEYVGMVDLYQRWKRMGGVKI